MRRMIAVASGKGGVGKTWFAISLGHALACMGMRTLLVDCDVGLANVDVQLGLAKGANLAAMLADKAPLINAIRPIDETGFDVLPGRSGSGQAAGLVQPLVEQLINELQGLQCRYDVIVLDLPSGVDHGVRRLMSAVDDRIVVTTEEPTALTDAYALIKATRKDGRNAPPKIIINLAESANTGEQTFQGLARVCDRFLKISPHRLGAIRRDRRVAEAISRQTSLLQCYPGCGAAEDVTRAAHNLVALARSP